MGARIEGDGTTRRITGGNFHVQGKVDAENFGTMMRIFSGICSIFDGNTIITGNESLRERLMELLLEALESTGTRCTSDNGLPSVTVRGPNRGGRVSIGDVSL